MWNKTDRAFDVMRERNRRYLEEQKKKEAENPADGNGESSAPVPASATQAEPSDEHESEQRLAEEKLRAYREANGLDPDAEIPDDIPQKPFPEEPSQEGPSPEGPSAEAPDPASSPEEEKWDQSLAESRAESRADEYRIRNAEPVKLEKGDVPAMIIAAILVFGPVFLVLIGIYLLAWIFLH